MIHALRSFALTVAFAGSTVISYAGWIQPCNQKYSFKYELLDSKCKGETKDALDKIEALPKAYVDAFNKEGGFVYIAKSQKNLPQKWQFTYDRMLLAFKPQGYKKMHGFMFEEPTELRLNYHAITLRNNNDVPRIALHEFGHALNGALHKGLWQWSGILSSRSDFITLCVAYEQKKYKSKKMDCNGQTLAGSWIHNEVWAEQFAEYYYSGRSRWVQKKQNKDMHDYFANLEKRVANTSKAIK